jgi:hypothetical protein
MRCIPNSHFSRSDPGLFKRVTDGAASRRPGGVDSIPQFIVATRCGAALGPIGTAGVCVAGVDLGGDCYTGPCVGLDVLRDVLAPKVGAPAMGDEGEGWAEARRRAAAVARTLPDAQPSAKLSPAQAARELGVDRATLYRWRRVFEPERRVSALLPRKCGRREGDAIISDGVEEIIQEEIDGFYLKPERPTLAELILRIQV